MDRKPETEDVGFTTIEIENKGDWVRSIPFVLGCEVKWEVDLNGATLEVNGFVLESHSYRTTLSELGVSRAERYWIVPTQLLRSAFI